MFKFFSLGFSPIKGYLLLFSFVVPDPNNEELDHLLYVIFATYTLCVLFF